MAPGAAAMDEVTVIVGGNEFPSSSSIGADAVDDVAGTPTRSLMVISCECLQRRRGQLPVLCNDDQWMDSVPRLSRLLDTQHVPVIT